MRALFIVIVLLFIIGYLLYLSYGDNFKDVLGDAVPLPEPIKDPCVFLENDIVTENVHDKYGKRVKKNMLIDCGRCGEYTYKGPDGCSSYQKDFLYSVKDNKTNRYVNVCSSLSFPRECKFQTKNPPQTE